MSLPAKIAFLLETEYFIKFTMQMRYLCNITKLAFEKKQNEMF